MTKRTPPICYKRGRLETDDVMMNTLGAMIGWWIIYMLI